MLHDVFQGTRADNDQAVPASSEQLARQQAIRQIERRRHFWIRATTGTVLMIIVAVIWGFSEYHGAGGWPTSAAPRGRADRPA